MAGEYSDTSIVVFSKIKDINWGDRFLFSGLAHILFFRGPVFYFIFSLICTLFLLYCVCLWFINNDIHPSFWEYLSIGTISFIAFQYFEPGYPDVLIHILILLALTLPLGEIGWLSLFVLSLATHEASIFIWFVLAIFFLNKKSWMKFFIIVLIYYFMRFAGGGFVISVLTSRIVGDLKPLDWVYYNFDRELLGIFFAFKLGWVIIITAMIGWIKLRKWNDLLLVGSLIVAGIVMTMAGIDTSRLAGWAFPALLFSWKFLSQSKDQLSKNILKVTAIANIFIPPYYIGLNGVDLPSGLYRFVIQLFSHF